MKKILISQHLKKGRVFVKENKKKSLLGLVILVLILYFMFRSSGTIAPRYVLADVVKGDLVTSVTGSGQVLASSQIDLKSKVSGDLVYIGSTAGSKVWKGQTLFSFDNRDAKKAVRDANVNLEQARLDLAQAKVGIKNTNQTQSLAVKNAYNNLLNSVIEATPENSSTDYSSAPTISGNYLLGKEGEIDIQVYFTGNGARFSTHGLVNADGQVTTVTPQPLGDSGIFIKFPTGNSTLNTNWVITIPNKKASNYLSNYNAYQSALENQAQNNDTSDVTTLNISVKELAVKKAENALTDANQLLSDYYISAPFDGVMASVPAQLGQPVSSGTVVGTIITNKKLAQISLNEVDVAKIKLGEKANLTFDAIDGLSINGVVADIDAVGTVTSGVVTYNVKIGFDTEDNRVKPGMSVSADIITNIKKDVLMVPSSAVKNQRGKKYVEVFDTPLALPLAGMIGATSAVPPKQKFIEVGVTNDNDTEIVSGLIEGEQIVARTITSSITKTTATAPSMFGTGGSGNKGGVRVGGK